MISDNVKKKDNLLSEDSFKALVELGEALRKIHNRMIAEGYKIKDGKIVKRNSVEQGGVK